MLQLKISKFMPGSYIIVEEKTDNNHFYIIQSGTVQCFKASRPDVPPTEYGPGDFIGVIGCMSGQMQIETVIAKTEVVAIQVKREQYSDLIVNNTPVALKILKTFATKMRNMNEALTKATLRGVVKTNYEQIFNVAQYYEKNMCYDSALFAYYQYLKTKPTDANAQTAKEKYQMLKQKAHPVFLEPTSDMTRGYAKDQMIFAEGSSGAEMFIIQNGEVKITKVVDGNEVILAVLQKGDMFGEMALIENKPRSASAIAYTNVSLMVVNRANFNQMVASQPQLISKLTTTLAERLWSMNRQLDNAALTDPLARMIDMLSLQIEKQKIDYDHLTTKQKQTDFTCQDIANMCGIPQERQGRAIFAFQSDSHVKLVNGKIFIKDIIELKKQAAFYRKGK